MNTLNLAEKKLSSIALLLQAIATVAIFLPFNYKEQWWKNYGDSYQLTNEHSISVFGGNYVRSGILGYLVLIFAIIAIAAFVLLLLGNRSRLTQVGIFSSIAALVFLIIVTLKFCLNSDLNDTRIVEVKMNWLIFIVFALQIAVSVISLLIAFKKVNGIKE